MKADNVSLVWCPNNASVPAEKWNQPANYYPGDRYVDWVGIDGYNWGFSQWQSFTEIFSEAVGQMKALTKKPLMIGEFAAAEVVQTVGTVPAMASKADWITDALQLIKQKYPEIKLFCWFNINKERDWRLDSSPAAARAAKEALQDRHFFDRMYIEE